MAVAPKCPADYWLTNTGDPLVRIVQKGMATTDEREGFCDLPSSKILLTASDNVQLEYVFYSLRRKVQAQVADQELGCPNICALGNKDRTDFSL